VRAAIISSAAARSFRAAEVVRVKAGPFDELVIWIAERAGRVSRVFRRRCASINGILFSVVPLTVGLVADVPVARTHLARNGGDLCAGEFLPGVILVDIRIEHRSRAL
jgi:hypothetical protein